MAWPVNGSSVARQASVIPTIEHLESGTPPFARTDLRSWWCLFSHTTLALGGMVFGWRWRRKAVQGP
jgi:hypothetical protein